MPAHAPFYFGGPNSLPCAPHLTKSWMKTSSSASEFPSLHPSQIETMALGIDKHPSSGTKRGTDVLLLRKIKVPVQINSSGALSPFDKHAKIDLNLNRRVCNPASPCVSHLGTRCLTFFLLKTSSSLFLSFLPSTILMQADLFALSFPSRSLIGITALLIYPNSCSHNHNPYMLPWTHKSFAVVSIGHMNRVC